MSYADKTFHDRNPIKRFLQRKRLKDAVHLSHVKTDVNVIVDFGAGNGELCKQLSRDFQESKIYCYEPHPGLLDEAKDNLKHFSNISFTYNPMEIAKGSVDILFCLEVFEHLPENEFAQALKYLESMLSVDGVAVIGVPVEIGLPALFKGTFRMLRRFGEFDAKFKHVIPAVFGNPPSKRPEVELMQGVYYHLHHLGFDHRQLKNLLTRKFKLLKISASPFPMFGPMVNSEINFLIKRA